MEPGMLGLEVVGPEVVGPEVMGPEAVGPEVSMRGRTTAINSPERHKSFHIQRSSSLASKRKQVSWMPELHSPVHIEGFPFEASLLHQVEQVLDAVVDQWRHLRRNKNTCQCRHAPWVDHLETECFCCLYCTQAPRPECISCPREAPGQLLQSRFTSRPGACFVWGKMQGSRLYKSFVFISVSVGTCFMRRALKLGLPMARSLFH